METFKINTFSLLLEIGVILFLINSFVYLVSFSDTSFPMFVIVLLNVFVFVYFGINKYVIKVEYNGNERILTITQIWFGKMFKVSIGFDEISYTYKLQTYEKHLPYIIPDHIINWKTLNIYFNDKSIKMTQNHLGWTGVSLDNLVYWFDISNIPRKKLTDIIERTDSYPDSYY